MALHVQHTRTQKKHFPCLKFGARISEQTGRPQASPVSLRMRVCPASAINNYCVHVNYYCLRKQLALVHIPQASKQLIVTLSSWFSGRGMCVIGVSLGELHTSMTAFHTCMCMACFWPLTVNFKLKYFTKKLNIHVHLSLVNGWGKVLPKEEVVLDSAFDDSV